MSLYKKLLKLANKLKTVNWIRTPLLPLWRYWVKRHKEKSIKNFHLYGREILKKIYSIFENTEIPIWLEFGTLLGAYREHNFIAHDFDIDLGAFFKDRREIQEILLKNGFILEREFSVGDGSLGFEQTYSYKDVLIDFFFFHLSPDSAKFYCNSFQLEKEDGEKWIAKEIPFPYSGITSYDFLSLKVLIPNEPKKHLSYHYGPNFMIPDKDFNVTKVTKIKFFTKEERPVKFTKYY